ncbi:YaaC family protein [Pelagivirga sediminicola]|nr:YaaC family protein [Pelagivirga sediminicola]
MLEASACLKQAQDFYLVGTERNVEAARPLALYYCYMNLLKVYCLLRSDKQSFNDARHGIAEVSTGTFESTTLRAFRSPNQNKIQNFSEMMSVLTGSGLDGSHDYLLTHILPQILPGHRIWCEATNERERFISFESIQFWQNKSDRCVWLNLYVYADDLSRLSRTHSEFLSQSGLEGNFREVVCERANDGRRIICFEQVTPTTYPASHPADALLELVAGVRHDLWATVSSVPPYRRYYAYLTPDAELESRLPQLLSIYALTFQLGSVTRYRPQEYDKILEGKFGARIQDFVTGQPAQFLYLLSSEILQQDITQPSII